MCVRLCACARVCGFGCIRSESLIASGVFVALGSRVTCVTLTHRRCVSVCVCERKRQILYVLVRVIL